MLPVCAFIVLLQQGQASAVPQANSQLLAVRKFVQEFYDWYAPLQDGFDRDMPVDAQNVVIQSQARLFDPDLISALQKAKVHARGRITTRPQRSGRVLPVHSTVARCHRGRDPRVRWEIPG